MKQVNVHEAKTHLSKLLDEVAAGEEIILAKAGKPVARIVPISARRPVRLGGLKGKLKVSDDFDTPLPDDILGSFYKDRF